MALRSIREFTEVSCIATSPGQLSAHFCKFLAAIHLQKGMRALHPGICASFLMDDVLDSGFTPDDCECVKCVCAMGAGDVMLSNNMTDYQIGTHKFVGLTKNGQWFVQYYTWECHPIYYTALYDTIDELVNDNNHTDVVVRVAWMALNDVRYEMAARMIQGAFRKSRQNGNTGLLVATS
jgi:hypothetical protein